MDFRNGKKREAKFSDSVLNTRLRDLIKRADIATFAGAVGVTVEAVRLWASGYSRPDIDKVASIARFFSVTTDFLLGLSDHENVSFSNYSDVSRILIQLMNSGAVFCQVNEVGYFKETVFSVANYETSEFFTEYQKMARLCVTEQISLNAFGTWVGAELNKLRELPMARNLSWEDCKHEFGFDIENLKSMIEARRKEVAIDGDDNSATS